MISVTYEHLRRDSLAFQAHWAATSWHTWLLLMVFVLLTLPATLSSLRPEWPLGEKLVVAFVVQATLVIFVVGVASAATGLMFLVYPNPGVHTTHTITASPSGLREMTHLNDSTFSWSGVRRIARTRTHIFVYVGPWAAYVIPRRALPSNDDFEALYDGLVSLKATSASA